MESFQLIRLAAEERSKWCWPIVWIQNPGGEHFWWKVWPFMKRTYNGLKPSYCWQLPHPMKTNEETNDEITNNQKKVVVVNSGLNISMVIVISSLIMSLVSSTTFFLFSALESFSECFLVPMHWQTDMQKAYEWAWMYILPRKNYLKNA